MFTGICHLAHVLTVPPTKACLLCATPVGMDLYIYSSMPIGTYQAQSLGFPKIIYSSTSFSSLFTDTTGTQTSLHSHWFTCITVMEPMSNQFISFSSLFADTHGTQTPLHNHCFPGIAVQGTGVRFSHFLHYSQTPPYIGWLPQSLVPKHHFAIHSPVSLSCALVYPIHPLLSVRSLQTPMVPRHRWFPDIIPQLLVPTVSLSCELVSNSSTSFSSLFTDTTGTQTSLYNYWFPPYHCSVNWCPTHPLPSVHRLQIPMVPRHYWYPGITPQPLVLTVSLS